MNWHKPARYHQYSADERYSVAKIGISDDRCVYEGWQTRQHPDGPHLICTNQPNAAAARALVEAHDADMCIETLAAHKKVPAREVPK